MVNINEIDSTEAAWGILEGRSIPKFDRFAHESPVGSGNYLDVPVGTSFTGVTVEDPKQYQATDFDTREPKFYEGGAPIMEVSIVLDTAYRTPGDDDDDGKRIVRLGAQGKRALQDEMRRLGIKRFGIGTGFQMTFTSYGVNKSGKGRPPKLYSITLTPTEYVAPGQRAVEHTLAQAGYVEQAAVAGFPPTAPQQQLVQPQQVVAQPLTPPVTQAHVDKVALLVNMNIDRQTAIAAVAKEAAPDSAQFLSNLDEAIPF